MKMYEVNGHFFPCPDQSTTGTIGPSVAIPVMQKPTVIDWDEFRFAGWKAPSTWQGRRTKKKFHGKKWNVLDSFIRAY